METPSTTRISVSFILAFVLLAVNSAVSYVTLDQLVVANRLVLDTERRIKLLAEVRSGITDAETGQRGFIITGQERYLDPYIASRPLVAAKLREARQLAAADAEHQARLALLGQLIDRRFEVLSEVLAVHKMKGMPAAIALVQGDSGKLIMDRIKVAIDDVQSGEEALLAARVAESEDNAYITMVTNAVAAFINICLLGGVFFLVMRDAAARRRVQAVERELNDRLGASLAQVRQRNEEITHLSQMSSFLQTCETSEEACAAIARYGPQLFPGEAGAIYLFHASRNYAERAAWWGDMPVQAGEMFPPGDCWALRRGRVHGAGLEPNAMACTHVTRHAGPLRACVCAPMMAQGDTIGLLYLQAEHDDKRATLGENTEQLAAAVAEQIALALSNLRLRETLRQQSVRDPLTGLHNRRFLEETLHRELARLERKRLPMSLIMIDVDNFKHFNDTFGHEAGDAVLRDLGGVLQRHVRGSDIACRYGGEEFTVILPEATLEIAQQRAETLREAARELRLVHDGKSLGAITLSLGVACFPDHGRRHDELLQAADGALYQAKDGGRNCVVVAKVPALKAVESLLRRETADH